MGFDTDSVIYAIDLFGTASFAFSGAIRALDRRPDIVGMIILAGATATGGAMVRDVVLDRDVLLLQDYGYMLVILGAAVITFFYPRALHRNVHIFMYFDAVGMGVFSALTATVALAKPGMNPLSVLFLATMTGCAGGMIRDVLINKPTLVLCNELYLTPIVAGAAALIAARAAGAPPLSGFFAAFLVTTLIRLLAIRFNWRLPRVMWVEVDPGESSPERP